MKKIGIVICNYNKEDYIVNCIRSVLEQSTDDFDVYVVDNASSDQSVVRVQEEFGDRVNLIINKENMGGSGGFNTGMREALKQDYKYIMLMDNDIVADKYAVEELFDFLEKHEDVGIVGSKVYYMDEPQKIWGYGGNINFDKYVQQDKYKNMVDSDSIPETDYCDFVAACSLMARADVIRKVGLMPEENFIYWDDMEWGYRFNQAGYKVAVYGKSKIWHKCGGRNAANTFNNYYMWRNRIRFFLKVFEENKGTIEEKNSDRKKEKFADVILDELFRMIYSCHLKGEDNIIRSVMYAFDDAVHGVTGKADEYKILPRTRSTVRIAEALGEAKSVLIKFNGDYEGLGNVVRSIRKNKPEIEIMIATEQEMKEEVGRQYKEETVVGEYAPEDYEAHMVMCEHIFKITKDMPQDVYVDSWCNIIYTEENFVYARSFEATKELFKLCKMGILIKK